MRNVSSACVERLYPLAYSFFVNMEEALPSSICQQGRLMPGGARHAHSNLSNWRGVQMQ